MESPFLPDTRAARHAFQRAALTAKDDVLSREASSRMARRLDYVKIAPRRVLDAGCGRGEDTRVLQGRYPGAEVTGLDWSHAALREALHGRTFAERAGVLLGRAPLRAACGEIERLPFASASFGLAWCNLSLAWVADPVAAFGELNRVLAPGGLLMFSSYGPDTLKELRSAFARADAHPHVHPFVDMHDLGDMLLASGLAAPVMDMEIITLTYADAPALFADLRRTGQTNAARSRLPGLMGRQRWRSMLAAYEQNRRDGRLPATVEIVFGHAWKGEARRADGLATVRFEPRAARRER